mmetsp:Transcript_46901/g.101899  ORF Transcript_46901/g.101899 Transcript_46901/m.101899 type:complete len:646 (-) Transcript_46901:34-1971(-)|eukprot:CAMPEP_0170607014 /NCGR_PEP_ID=MMETSP0224-20130122/20825_1 /TAXON_ID=285029 /ORGANISM="Togula jolla, Strain CCCM 725" /LENGTH=645 /DNA_ID=CAMNT_0010932145 /DNA_START=122 /DNA_END=2059 /DNA_ORIENTATION=-
MASRWALAFWASLSLSVQGASGEVCQVSTSYSGGSYRWPVANPAMAAPAQLQFDYPTFKDPVKGEFTGTSIYIPMPQNYGGSLVLAKAKTSADTAAEQETYRLTAIELRKPGQVPEGIGQVLSHIFEMALIHEQVGGGYRATVVIPFSSSGQSFYDVLAPIVLGAKMPTEQGQQESMLLSSAQPLMLSRVFEGATFLNFWTRLPTNCPELSANSRQFMRTTTLNLGQDTFSALLETLVHAPAAPPIQSPAVSWLMTSCPLNGQCTNIAAQTLTEQLTSAKESQSIAVAELRERKGLMDKAYDNLVSKTEGALELAVSARADLKSADSILDSAARYANQIEVWYNQSNGAVWDSNAPGMHVTGDSTGPIMLAGMSSSSTLGAAKAHLLDCTAYRMSPVDIDTWHALDPGAIDAGLREPLLFATSESTKQPRWNVSIDEALYMRLVPVEDLTLPSVKLGGSQRRVSHIELHVPGQHAVNGHVAPAELQLLHEAEKGQPIAGVALPLEVAGSDISNSWIEALLKAQPTFGQEVEAEGVSMTELHSALSRQSVEGYFHYDGTLTSPPCSATQWFVLEEPALMSQRQLEALQLALGFSAGVPDRQRFRASLVSRGGQHLVSQLGVEKMLLGHTKRLTRSRLRNSHVQIKM